MCQGYVKMFNRKSSNPINSFADIPTMGTGLGGSSAFTCALVRALGEYCGQSLNEYDTAELACHIEIKMCGWNIGKQDQYASAFGGMNYIRYFPLGEYDNITVQRIHPNNIDRHMLLIPTNITRHAAEILDSIDMHDKSSLIMELASIANEFSVKKPDYIEYGKTINESWLMKKTLQQNVSNEAIDEMYKKCLQYGAEGAKLLGAGGGGYMLALAENKQKIKDAFADRVCLDVNVATEGAKVVYRD